MNHSRKWNAPFPPLDGSRRKPRWDGQKNISKSGGIKLIDQIVDKALQETNENEEYYFSIRRSISILER